jgi:hypothetical protein
VTGTVHTGQVYVLISGVRKGVVFQSCVIKSNDWVGVEDATTPPSAG